jgi:hypothetical protein
MSVGDYKSLIEEMRVEFDKLEAGISTRLHALLDRLTGHVPAIEAEAKADAEHVAGDIAADVTAAVETPAPTATPAETKP